MSEEPTVSPPPRATRRAAGQAGPASRPPRPAQAGDPPPASGQPGAEGPRGDPGNQPEAGGPAGRQCAPRQQRGQHLGEPAGELSLSHADAPQRVREGQARPADRTAQGAELGEGDRPARGGPVRRPRRRRQGRHHQALHGTPEPARRADRSLGETVLPGAGPVVFPALHPTSAHRRRDGLLRPLLVQPRRRRAGHGLLFAAAIPGVHAPGAGAGAHAHQQRHPAVQVLVLGEPRGTTAALHLAPRRSAQALEAVAHRHQVSGQVGRLHRRQAGDVLPYRHRRRAVDGHQVRRQEARATQLHPPLPALAGLPGQGPAHRP